MEPDDWTTLAREGRTLEAIVAYRASVGVGLGEAKQAVDRWLAINLPPSAAYRRAVEMGQRVAERLARYTAESGRPLAYTIRVLAVSEAEFVGHPTLLFAELPEGHEVRDLVVEVELPGVPHSLRRQTVVQHLDSHTQMVWLIDGEDTTIRVATQPSRWTVWHDDAAFDGGDVLPGFSCQVADLFA